MGIAENWSRENLAWAGGLFEGEGCISLDKKPAGKKSARLRITSTDKDVLDRFRMIIGVGVLNGPYINRRHPHYKPKWAYSASGGRSVYPVLVALWPFLCSRRQAKAEEAIRYISEQGACAPTRRFCGNGHEYTAENTAYWAGRKACRACSKARSAAKYERETPVRVRGYYKKKKDKDGLHKLHDSAGRDQKRAA